MKKYILYDDKVYEIKVNKEVKEQHFADYYYIKTSPYAKLHFTKNKLEKYKTADSIEELCDELVIDTPSCRHHMSTNYIFDDINYNPDEELEMLKEKEIKYAIYGAIWTDKGLIYVAKMNDKEELELI